MANIKGEFITVEGKKELEERHRQIIEVEMPEIVEQIQNARAMGDLSENADYQTAKDKQAKIQAELEEIEYKLANYKVVEGAKNAKVVGISSIVRLKDLATNEVYTVKIVSSSETDILNTSDILKISNESPLGEALINKKVGDIATVKVAKPYDVEIEEIRLN